MTKPYTVRIPDDRKSATEHKARKLGKTFSEGVNAALEEWNGKPAECAKCRHLTGRQAALEEELDRLRRHLASIREWDADDTQLTKREDILATQLEAATPESPVTPTDLMVLTGTRSSRSYVPRRLTALMGAGVLGRRESGRNSYYWAVPGSDIRKALLAARSRNAAPQDAPETADGRRRPVAESRPAPGKPPAAHTEPQPSPPAAAGPGVAAEVEQLRGEMKQMQDLMLRMAAGKYETPAQDRVARVREAIAGKGLPQVITASELAATPAIPVFRAGPDVDCLHENLRDGKGVCPDCRQQVKRTA